MRPAAVCATVADLFPSQVSLPKRPRSFHGLLPTLRLCTACDAAFPTRHDLRQHGAAPQAREACRAAVEYDFE